MAAACPWGNPGLWTGGPLRYAPSKPIISGRPWNSLDFLIEHARRDLKTGERDVNPYIIQFIQSAYLPKLRNLRFHNLMNIRHLKKEIVESLSALQKVGKGLGGRLDDPGVLLIDMCSGKGITAALAGLAFPRATVLMLDRNRKMRLDHLKHLPNVTFHNMDVHSPAFMPWLRRTVAEHRARVAPGTARVGVIAIHLCGHLSTTAIDAFNRTPGIDALGLFPCCLPCRSCIPARARRLGRDAHTLWCWELFHQINGVAARKDLGRDPDMHTKVKWAKAHAKNVFICAQKRRGVT